MNTAFPDPPAAWVLSQTPVNEDEARALRSLLGLRPELRAIIWADPKVQGLSCLSLVPYEHQTALCRRGLAYRERSGCRNVILTGRAMVVRAWLVRFQEEGG